MPAPVRTARLSYGAVIAVVLLGGVVASLVSYRLGTREEQARGEAEFAHRAALRHALVREILGHYADALFGLSALFVASDNVTLAEFTDATDRIARRITGVRAFEWVPLVTQEDRARTEAALARTHRGRPFQFVEFAANGAPRPAAERPYHYPIAYVNPVRENEVALGYDLAAGPTRAFLERARETGRIIVTSPFLLVQERAERFGVVMICPVYRGPSGDDPTPRPVIFTGFLQCVFRLHELLETAHARQPDTSVDMLFIDASETDAAKRMLYYQAGGADAPAESVTEETFRAGVHRELPIPFGEREWRVLLRPSTSWMERQHTSMPFLRSGSLLLLAGLVAGIMHTFRRRADMVRREVEQRTAELAESRRQITSMLHALPGMAYRCTYGEQLEVLFVSEGAFALTGWTAEEIMGGVVHFRDFIHPDDVVRVRDVSRTALLEQSDMEVEYRLRTRAGEEKWVLSRGRGVQSADQGRRLLEGLAIDITAQKSAEAARLALERKVLEGQKLESLGLLAGGIAHDFNNLLSSILGNASLARLKQAIPGGMDEQLRAIETASLRAAELCRQMLAYAGKGRFVIEPIDVTALIEELQPLLKISLAHQGALRLELQRDLPPVSADAAQLRQIVINLVLNSTDAISAPGGEIVVSTGLMHADHGLLAECVAGAGLPGGDYVFVEVRDNGSGMTPEVVAKIFDPFFTTKFAGRGLGLAAVLGIVRGHHGALRVTSTAGAGTAFRLLLPPAGAKPAKPSIPAPTGSRWHQSANVLIIEDEEAVQKVTAAILKSYGITPQLAANGEEGVAAYRAGAASIDVVMLDLLMPGLSGERVLAELRTINPDVRVLLISGYSEGDILGRLASDRGKLLFLAKPFTRNALERKLRGLLG